MSEQPSPTNIVHITSLTDSVAGIIRHPYADKILTVTKAYDGSNMSGLEHLPGGGLLPYETGQEGMMRETLEESGIHIIVKRHLGLMQTKKKLVGWWYCDALTEHIREDLPAEIGAANWRPTQEIPGRCAAVYDMWPAGVQDYFARFQ